MVDIVEMESWDTEDTDCCQVSDTLLSWVTRSHGDLSWVSRSHDTLNWVCAALNPVSCEPPETIFHLSINEGIEAKQVKKFN